MHQIPDSEIKRRLAFDNPWWETKAVAQRYREWPRRSYFDAFVSLVTQSVRRAIILMGPRRVGKTVLIQQTVQHLIASGISPARILYVSLDTPTYIGLSLEKLTNFFFEKSRVTRDTEAFAVFDEIQYLRDWEIHLKSLVDSYPKLRIIVSGSAAAALRVRSRESGAGRFTDFLLPPLTFAEFIRFRAVEESLIQVTGEDGRDFALREGALRKLNAEFVNYVNFGGFPEAVLVEPVRADFTRFIGSDILDKVLLKDLPSLYGIADTQELNRLFATLAYNTGNELSLEALSQSSGVAKNTLRRYLEYLEAAFLIRRVHRLDHNARHFRRAVSFKVYLTNPCLRAALFGAVSEEDEAMGRLAESAVYSQLFHSEFANTVYYARWHQGEVDLVLLDPRGQRPVGAFEVKWSDRIAKHPEELKAFLRFSENAKLADVNNRVLTRSFHGTSRIQDHEVLFMPVSWLCYLIGKVTIEPILKAGMLPRQIEAKSPH